MNGSKRPAEKTGDSLGHLGSLLRGTRRGPKQHLVLVGLGHGHLEVLRTWSRDIFGVPLRITAITPNERLYYSGMASGVLAGQYTARMPLVPAVGYAETLGVTVVRGRAERIDLTGRRVWTSGGEEIDFDWLSIAVGSRIAPLNRTDGTVPQMPLRPLHSLAVRLDEAVAGAGEGPVRVVVVGGGAAAVEAALCLAAPESPFRSRLAERPVMLAGDDDALAAHPVVRRELEAAGWEVATDHAAAIAEGAVHGEDGPPHAADLAVLATGPEPPEGLAHLNLPLAEDGFLRIDRTLRVVDSDHTFAIGDCASLGSDAGGNPAPKSGVHALRQGGAVYQNIKRIASGQPADDYPFDRGNLQLLNVGDGRALATYGHRVRCGRWAWWLKDRLDRWYVDSFR